MPGYPIVIDGIVSPPAFDSAGRIHLTVGTPTTGGIETGPARTLVLDTQGREVIGGSGNLGFVARDSCVGIEGTCSRPAAPLVGPDGTTFVVGGTYNDTTVASISPIGEVLAGWPYRSYGGVQPSSICDGDICEGSALAIPALGPNHVLYLIHGPADDAVGSSIVAIGLDGRVRDGWPVELTRSGSQFRSVVVGSDGTAYALAIEPEGADATSATILAIAPDSTIVYTATVVDP